MSIRSKLLGASLVLAKIPSFASALIYLLLIPLFALIYYEMPGEFYQATLVREAPLNLQFDNIKYQLNRILYSQFNSIATEHHVRSRVLRNSNTWGISFTDIDDVRITGEEVSFLVKADIFQADTPVPNLNLGQYRIQQIYIGAKFQLSKDRADNSDNLIELPLQLEIPPDTATVVPNRDMQVAVGYALFPLQSFPSTLITKLPEQLLSQIQTYQKAQEGVGSESDGNFWRMMYLSAVTITTVGYGDIVPMTGMARLFVSSEAVLGIVLIGLFLNALNYERAIMEESTRKLKIQDNEVKSDTP